jgi:integrase
MSVKVRQYKRGGWEVDIRVSLPDGTEVRERRKAPCTSKSAAQKWGEERANHLCRNGMPRETKEVPKLEAFWQTYRTDHMVANQLKASTKNGVESVFKVHLVPILGEKRLDEIQATDVQRIKSELSELKASTVNRVLIALRGLLRTAVRWNVITAVPCPIEKLKEPPPAVSFFSFEEYEQLLAGAAEVGAHALAAVLLGGDAGLRRGEVVALERSDLDFSRGVITVARSSWRGIVSTPKGGRSRQVEMTERLRAALLAIRHLRGPSVLCDGAASAITDKTLSRWMRQAKRKAGFKTIGKRKNRKKEPEHDDAKSTARVGHGFHILRHTFCSHLALQGAPVMVIKELAGHRDLLTTMRYMHLSPTSKRDAIRLLDRRPSVTAEAAPQATGTDGAGSAQAEGGAQLGPRPKAAGDRLETAAAGSGNKAESQ